MASSKKGSLTTRLAIAVAIAALAIGMVLSQLFFQLTFDGELEQSQHDIEQLNRTVSATASIAAYLEDSELISEVINGLVSNDIVQSVAIATQTINAQSPNHLTTEQSLVFDLYSPFEKERLVGTITITPNLAHIEARAKQIGWDNLLANMMLAVVITVAVIVVSYFMVSSPIVRLAHKLHDTEFGNEKRLTVPNYHKHSEIGLLASDVNLLLARGEQQIKQERQLREQVERLSKHVKLIFDHSSSPIILTELNGEIILYNQAFIELLAKLNISLLVSFDCCLADLFADKKHYIDKMNEALNNNEVASGEFKLKSNDSLWVQVIINSTNTEDGYKYHQITLHDISLRRQQIEQLNAKAYYDKLTRLLNRRGAEQALEKLEQKNTPFALILMDLNRFKPINDIYGHDVGDEVLIHIASQLTSCMTDKDMLARWGGDEFVIVLNQQEKYGVKQRAIQLKASVEKPLHIDRLNKEVSVGACMGVAFYPEDAATVPELIKAADQAMYSLKLKKEHADYLAFYKELSEKQ